MNATRALRLLSIAVVLTALPCFFLGDALAAYCPNGGGNVCLFGANGYVIQQPQIYLVTWNWLGSDPDGEAANLQNFLYSLPGTSNENLITEYFANGTSYASNNVPQFAPTHFWADDDPVNNPIILGPGGTYPTDATIGAEATRAAQHFGVLVNADTAKQAIIIVATPDSAGSLSGACARHWYQPLSADPTYRPLTWIEYPYGAHHQGCDNELGKGTSQPNYNSAVLEHELIEAVTDPLEEWTDQGGADETGWLDRHSIEIGDMCKGSNPNQYDYATQPDILVKMQVNNPGGASAQNFGVAQFWSRLAAQGAGACVYSYKTHQTSFFLGSDSQIWKQIPGGDVACGRPGGLQVTGDPAAVSWGPSRVDIFAKVLNGFTTSIGHLYSNDGANSFGNDNWGTIPGAILAPTGRIAVASWGSNQLDLFAKAQVSGTTHLFHYAWQGTGWHDLGTPPTTSTISDPAAVSWGQTVIQNGKGPPDYTFTYQQRYDVFVTGGDNHLWGLYSNDGGVTFSAWTDWGTYVGGLMTGSPAVASLGPNRLDLFVPTWTGNQLAHRWFTATSNGWDTWNGPSGIEYQGVGATDLGDNRLLLQVSSSSTGHVWQLLWDWGTVTGWNDTGTWASQANGAGKDITLTSW